MGLARHNPGGQTRLGLSATAGSAVLYGAIVVFGIGSASPSALDVGGDRHGSVVLVPGHADIVPGSVKKLPQASPEPGRHRSGVRPQPARTEVVSAPSPEPTTAESQPAPAPPRGKESTSPAVSSSSTAPVAEPTPGLTIPTLTVPELPAPLPPPPVQLPELSVPPLPLPLPVALPLDLPG
jgi:hypothetical protein